jgi:ABC-2 type transport system permease protein
MNIFLRELKANLKSLIIWSVIMVMFVVVGITKFSAYEGNSEMLEVLDSMPPALMAGLQMNAFNLTTITGFFGVMFMYFALLGTISATMWGSDIISKEERDKTVEFSLTLPVSRNKVVTAKIAAAIVNCIAFLGVTWLASIAATATYNPDAAFYEFLSLCMATLFMMQMIFLSVGILLGCAMKQYKRAGSIAVGILMGTYFLSIVTGMNKNLDFLKYFSPFTYFDRAQLLNESSVDPLYVVLSLAIIVVSYIAAYVTYGRRDLYI